MVASRRVTHRVLRENTRAGGFTPRSIATRHMMPVARCVASRIRHVHRERRAGFTNMRNAHASACIVGIVSIHENSANMISHDSRE